MFRNDLIEQNQQQQIFQLRLITMLQAKKITTHSHTTRTYLYLYYLTFFNIGLFSCNFGTLIPYLAQLLHTHQTQFSFIFLANTIGMGFGILSFKYIQKTSENVDQHKIMFYAILLTAFSCLLFVLWQSILGIWIATIFIGATGFACITIINTCMVFISAQNPAWVSTAHGLFGLGALIAPQLVRFLQIHIYTLNAILFVLLSIAFYNSTSPQHKQTIQQQQKKQMKIGSLKLQIFFGVSLWMYIGVELTVNGWIPSYSVLAGIKNSTEATIYGTIFWIMMTICRLGVPHLPYSITIKLKIALYSLVFTSIVSLIIHSSAQYGLAVMFAAVFFGCGCSIVFPFIFSVSYEYGIKFKKEQTTNFLLGTVLSSGLLTSPTGQLMKLDIKYLFISILVMSSVLLLLVLYIFNLMSLQSASQITQQHELQQKILKK